MSVIEKVKPIVVDGVEFYVSNDGKESGMSISGLANFLSLDRKAISYMVDKLLSDDGNGELPKCLKPFTGMGFMVGIVGNNNAKIIPARLCEGLLYYYAYESTNVSDEVRKKATDIHRQAAQVGLHETFKKVSGYIEENNETKLLEQFKQLYSELKSLNEFASEYKAIKNTTTTFMPGCAELLDDIVTNDDNLLLPTETGALSIEGWLHSKGITLTATKFRQLAHMTSATFKSMVKQDPGRTHFKLANGKTKYNVSVYEPQHFAIIQMCLGKILHDD
jgi:hypothetical protein